MNTSIEPNRKIIYSTILPLKVLFSLEIILGFIVFFFFLFLFSTDIFPGILTFAGPFLALALLISGLKSSNIEKIYVSPKERKIEVQIVSLFKTKTTHINLDTFKVQLKNTNIKKKALISRIKLVILGSNEGNIELSSNFISLNNSKIKNLYLQLKAIQKLQNS